MCEFSMFTKLKSLYRIFLSLPMFVFNIPWNIILLNDSYFAHILRKKIIRTQCGIDTNVLIKNRNNFTAGEGSYLYHGCYILNSNGKFILGNNSHLGAYCFINVAYGTVCIGDDVAIGPGTKIFAYSNHFEREKRVTEVRINKDIIIKNNVFIGANCTILPGTTINDNVIVGAGSVIKGNLESNCIYAGVPCKRIKEKWYEE